MSMQPIDKGWAALSAMEKIKASAAPLINGQDSPAIRQIIFDSIADGLFTVDNDQVITSFNRAAERITGVPKEEAIGKKCYEVFRADICTHDCALKKTMETGEDIIDCRVNISDADNRTFPINISTAILHDERGNIMGGVETFREIPGCELRSSTILNSVADGVFTVDNDRIITFFNQAAEKITGVPKAEAIGKKCYEVFRADICTHDCALKKTMETGEDIIDCPVRIKNTQDLTIPVSISTAILRDENDNIMGGAEIIRCLSCGTTHRRTILDSVADGVFTIDNDQIITSFNRAAEEITGVPKKEAIGKKCYEVFRADICTHDCALKKTMETGEDIIDRRVKIINADNRTLPISISTAILHDEHGNIMGGVETFRDLSTEELLRKQISDHYTFEDIISKSHKVRQILDILPDIATSDSTVLIEGPSGSGKEMFARAIHNLSRTSDEKFIAINCGALPDTLLESELFGYVKGAFTDAKKDKPGRFAMAHGGTILLDEIGDISPALQIKLLRVLQEREYEPLGATYTIKTDARVIAATNRNLPERVARGQFRDDLYYRLNVVKISLPSLAERREDIPLLVDHFMTLFNTRKGKDIHQVSEEAMAILMEYDFPGNVRELENIIEYAFVLCRGREILPEHLPHELVNWVSSQDVGTGTTSVVRLNPIAQAEADAIKSALLRNNGSKQKTAEEMKIHKTTLWRKMKKYGLA